MSAATKEEGCRHRIVDPGTCAVKDAPAVYACSSHVRIGDALQLINGRAFKPSEWSDQGLPIVRIQNLNDPDAPFNYYPGALPEKFRLKMGDLLFAWSGTPGTSFGAHIWYGGDAWLNQHIFKVLFDDAQFDKRFLRYAINQNLNQYIAAAHGGAGLAHITKRRFEESTILCLPLEAQRRIVAEIEKQFSRLDEARANLKRVKANLKRYKAAVLKSAVEGRLVPPEADIARRQGRSYETGPELLGRILEVRRSQWSARGKYLEPSGPDSTAKPPLPDGWVWASAEQLSDFITKGATPAAKKLSGGAGEVQFLKVYNLTFDGSLGYNYKPAFVDRQTHVGELARSKVRPGDVLINIVGPPLGQVSIVPELLPEANINQAIARFRPIEPLSAKFLALTLMSEHIMSWAIRRAKTTAGQANLTLELCRALPVPLPPLAEQHRIVAEVERRLSVVAQTEVQVDEELSRAAHLEQGVLSAQFETHDSSANVSLDGCGSK